MLQQGVKNTVMGTRLKPGHHIQGGNLIFLDLYVRSYVRGKAVQVLVDAGLKVEVYGDAR